MKNSIRKNLSSNPKLNYGENLNGTEISWVRRKQDQVRGTKMDAYCEKTLNERVVGNQMNEGTRALRRKLWLV